MGYGAPGVKTFLGLDDTPDSYAGKPLKIARVKAALGGLEFAEQLTQYEIPTNIAPDQLTQEYAGTIGGSHRMIVVGHYLISCTDTSEGEIKITDITDIENPTVLSTLEAGGGHFTDVAVAGKYLFILDSSADALRVYDWSNPRDLSVVGGIAIGSSPYRCALRGRYLYVALQADKKLVVVDVSDPANPQIVGSYTHATYLYHAGGIALSGNYAFVRGVNYVTCVNIADPTNPTYVSFIAVSSTLGFKDGKAMTLSGKYLYVLEQDNDKLRIIDVSNPAAMSETGSLIDATYLKEGADIVVIGNWAFISTRAAEEHCLTIVDCSDKTSPEIHDYKSTSDLLGAITLAGKFLFAAMWASNNCYVWSVWAIDIPAFIGNSIYAEYIYTTQLDVADRFTAAYSQMGGMAIPESLPKVSSIPLLLTQVVATDPDTAYTELSALYRTNLDFSKLGIKEARIIVSGIGNEGTAGKGIQIWNSTDSAEICKVEWNGDTQQNALASSWATVSLRKAVDVQIRVKASSATEDITVDKVELQLRAA
ncbi:hypothetical protein ES703_13844 [subsurface metagenome]